MIRKQIIAGIAAFTMLLSGMTIPADMASAKDVVYQGVPAPADDEESTGNTMLVDLAQEEDVEATKLTFGKQVDRVIKYQEDFEEHDFSLSQNYVSLAAGFPKLQEFTVEEGNMKLTASDGVLYGNKRKELIVCPLQKNGVLTVADGTEKIGRKSVIGCQKITQIVLPASVKTIQNGAFGGNISCTGYVVDPANVSFTSVDGILYSKDQKRLIAYPAGKKETEFQVPEGVERIEDTAFMGNPYLETVTLASTTNYVGNSAFQDCTALETCRTTAKLEILGADALRGCAALAESDLREGLLYMGENIFVDTDSLSVVTIPQSVLDLSGDFNSLSGKKIIIYRYSEIGDIYFSWTKKYRSAYDVTVKDGIKIEKKTVSTKVGAGKGKPDTSWYREGKKVYRLSDADDLAGLAKLVKKGKTFKGCTVRLTRNINLKKYSSWTPIGGVFKNMAKNFNGTFDGKGHTIYNLSVKGTSESQGLFGRAGKKSVIKNVTLKGAYVLGHMDTGAVAGSSSGKIESCKVYGSVQGVLKTGGIAGYAAVVKNCRSYATVYGTRNVGGVAGLAKKAVSCQNKKPPHGYAEVKKIANKS